MPAVEILNVAVPGELPEAIRAARIRLPDANAVGETFTFETFDFLIAGMVLPHEGLAQSIEVYCGGMRLRTIPVKFPRDGLSRAFPDLPDELVCGFRSPIGAMTLPPEFELDLVAVLENGNRARIGSITGRRERPRLSIDPKLQALQLTSVGRTGTTWMMRMLAAHPGIVAHTNHPLEVWPARYWAHMLKVLSGPADPISSVTSHNFDQDLWHAGQNPFHIWPTSMGLGKWLGREHVDRLASFCLQNVEDWYTILARQFGKDAVYFAEKNLLRTPVQGLGVADLYPDTREVFLVRDFRDMACSWFSFRGAKWNEAGFDTDRALQEMVLPWADLLLSNWRARKEQAHLVHYEDLVLKPQQTLRDLFDFLAIDSSDETLDQVASAGTADQGFTAHKTSPNLERTVGRWRREGDEAFRAALNSNFRELLDEFGYAEAAAPEPA